MSGHSFWLIERGQAQQQEPTLWWKGQSGDWTGHTWTHKAIEAFRFPTREAAQAEIDKYEARRIGIGNLTVELGVPTEHVILPVETRGPDSRTQFSSCCAKCGKPADIEVGPVNDVLNVHLVPRCDCVHVNYPSGFNLWWPIQAAAAAERTPSSDTWRNDPEVQRQRELFYDKVREMVGYADDLPSLYGVCDAAPAPLSAPAGTRKLSDKQFHEFAALEDQHSPNVGRPPGAIDVKADLITRNAAIGCAIAAANFDPSAKPCIDTHLIPELLKIPAAPAPAAKTEAVARASDLLEGCCSGDGNASCIVEKRGKAAMCAFCFAASKLVSPAPAAPCLRCAGCDAEGVETRGVCVGCLAVLHEPDPEKVD